MPKKSQSSTRPKSGSAPPPICYLQVSPRGTITLPKRLRENIQMVAVERREDGVIELRPKVAVDESQAWFWTARWQQMEREAEAEIRSGKLRRFKNVEELIKDLDA